MNYYAIPGLKVRPKLVKYYTKIEILNAVCNHFGCNLEQLTAVSRLKDIVFQRHIAQYLLCTHTSMSLKGIGAFFGQDHATIIHAKKSIAKQLELKHDNDYKSHISKIKIILDYEN